MPYTTPLEIVDFLGIGKDIINESVGAGDGTTSIFFLTKTKVVTDSEEIRVAGVVQVKDTDYSIDYDKGKITFLIIPVSGAITADYVYTAIKSSVIQQYIDIIQEEDILQGIYLLQEDEIVGKDSNDRYFVNFRFFADSNLDGVITKDDLIVYEFNNDVKVVITDEVSLIDANRGFFELNSGFPTDDRSVMITYRYAKYPIEQILDDLKAFIAAGVARFIFSRPKAISDFGGLSSWSVNGNSVSKGGVPDADSIIARYDKIFNDKKIRMKPFKVRIVGDAFQLSEQAYTEFRDMVPSRLITRSVNLGGIVLFGGFRFNNQIY